MIAGASLEEVVVGGEGRHDISIVGDGNAVEGGHRSGDLVGCQESHDSDLGEATVVELGDEALLLLLGGPVLGESEGVVEVERDGVDGLPEEIEGREHSGLRGRRDGREGGMGCVSERVRKSKNRFCIFPSSPFLRACSA